MSVFSRAATTLRDEGVASTAWRARKWLASRRGERAVAPLSQIFPQDLAAADWMTTRDLRPAPNLGARPRVAWIISPLSANSGGHQTAFRLMSFLEQAGYDLTVYLYSAARYPKVSVAGIRRMLDASPAYPNMTADLRVYDPDRGVEDDVDAVVASDWATAYAAWRYDRDVPRFYLVQDFEPWFFAHGPDYVAAENSYRLGLHGITVGPWLAKKLAADYKMRCDHVDFAVDATRYTRTNDSERHAVGFYVRPGTGRRGTEFGLLALEDLHRRRPDIDIHLFGWDMARAGIPFPFTNHGAVSVTHMPGIFNACAALLTISLTNPSLVPLEAVACGTVPVLNDSESTRQTFGRDRRMVFAAMSPSSLADALIRVVDNPHQVDNSRRLAASLADTNWSDSGRQLVSVFDRALKPPATSRSRTRKG